MTYWTWQIPFIFVGLLAVIPMVLRRPAMALYVLIGAATVIEMFPMALSDSLTDTIPFFQNLNNSAQLPMGISPAEIVMASAILAWIITSATRGAIHRPSRRMLRAYGAYMFVVLMAEGWGLINGGDFNHSLWELRPQVYGFLLFLLSMGLVRERRQVVILATVFLAGATLKTGVGYYRYFITLHGDIGNADSILAHEDTYFLVMFLVAAVAAAIWVRRRGVVLLLLAPSPIVAVVMLENRRRVGMLALIAALAVVVALAIRFEPKIRKRVIVVSAISSVLFAIFAAAEWNATDGLAGQIVRPLRTTLTGQVDQRDYLSNLYRNNENANIIATYQTNRLIGVGFGLPMLMVFPLADISQQYPLWNYIPHNTVLWIGMRMGILGMAAFWALIGMIILEGVRALRSTEDPLLRAVAAFALAAVIAELIAGYGDVQLENYRNMIFFGVMVGLIDALPRVRKVTVATVTVEEGAAERRWALAPVLSTSPERRASSSS